MPWDSNNKKEQVRGRYGGKNIPVDGLATARPCGWNELSTLLEEGSVAVASWGRRAAVGEAQEMGKASNTGGFTDSKMQF